MDKYCKGTREVVNLSSCELEDAELSILKQGLNFALPPNSILVDSTIYNIEYSIQSLVNEDKESIR
jgi:hypothetical protein